jgi:omega-amidase
MQDLRVTLVQTDLHWEDPEANRAMIEEKIWAAAPETDLIILPEMFTTGFTMNAEKLAEPANLHTHRWMQLIASQTKAVVAGSYIVKEKGSYYNRLVWMRPDGSFDFYNKRHLFRMGGEDKIYAAGQEQKILDVKGWKVCLNICYDLRFPVWSRNRNNSYDLLLYIASWPAVRNFPWKSLLTARAIENLAYTVGVNRVGKDGNGLEYSGDSCIRDFRGFTVSDLEAGDAVVTSTLNKSDLEEFRTKFPAQLDSDEFVIKY